MTPKINLPKLIKWHRALGWCAGFALIFWGGSGLLHPLMSWVSVKPVAFTAPAKATIDWNKIELSPDLAIRQHRDLRAARLLMVDGAPMLQLSSVNDAERHFISLGSAAAPSDKDYAITLARHYSGNAAPIKTATLITEFSRAYPPVNRLLPVWRITFDRADGLAVYVDTGNDRLGTMTTNLKVALLKVFQTVHTLDFLAPLEAVRVLIIGFLILTIICITGLGIALIIRLRRNRLGYKARGWHRRLSYIAWLPALTFAVSGFFHLVTSSSLRDVSYPVPPALQSTAPDMPHVPGATELRLLTDNRGAGYWLSLPDNMVANNPVTDFALLRVEETLQSPEQKTYFKQKNLSPPELKKTFDTEYGFLNRRLPVWRIADTQNHYVYFYDAIDNIIVTRVDRLTKSDNWFFANFHKWQFMNPLGLLTRDLCMMAAVILLVAMSGFGLKMLLRKR